MKILKEYHINYQDISDTLVVYSPTTQCEKNEMYKFRYINYLKKHYIDSNVMQMDIDEYDEQNNVCYINIISQRQNRIIGSLRIIYTDPLPIIKDCFDFNEPLIIKIFGNKRLLEVGRLIVDKYDYNKFLPRHLVMTLLINEVVSFATQRKILFGYAFIKMSLYKKLKSIIFPFFLIRNYKIKYKIGVLKKYFLQKEDTVIPIFFINIIVKIYLFFAFIKFKKYLCL